MLIRLIILAAHFAAFRVTRTYLIDHRPYFKGEFVDKPERLLQALMRMWGLLLWPLPGLIWIGMIPVPALIIIILSTFIPLSIFLVFYNLVDIPETTAGSKWDRLFLWMGPGVFVLLTLLILLQTFRYPVPLFQFLAFLTFVTFPPTLSILALAWTIPDAIPVAPDQHKRMLRILQLFTGFFTTFPKPSWIVENGEVKTRIQGNTFFGVGPGWLMTEPENLVVLKGSTKIGRIIGPDAVFTRTAESPYQVIDLRNQIRVTRVDARTQDGIEVNLPISSLFRIDPGYKTITLEGLRSLEPWPYRKQRDIYQIVFYEEVDPTGKTPLEAHQTRPWDDIPLKAAMNRVKQIIPEYSLEQLYSIVPESGTIDPTTGKVIPETGDLTRSVIGLKVRETVKAAVEPLGFQILGGGIGNKITPTNPDVVKQRVEIWKARWISKVMDWETEAQIQNLKDLSSIRSDARVELLSQILDQTSMKLGDAENASRYVAYHLLENLLHLARNSQVEELLPETALPTLTQLQELMKEE